jgi:hypothetical protein
VSDAELLPKSKEEPVRRLEVFTDAGRRRAWTPEQKDLSSRPRASARRVGTRLAGFLQPLVGALSPRAHLQQIMEPAARFANSAQWHPPRSSDKMRDYLVFGSLMLRNWRVASTTDFSIGNRSADEPPT